MAEEGDVLTDLNPQANGNGAETGPVAGIVAQYVKDLSVENPKAPESLQWTDQPEYDVQFNIGARQVNEELSEVELKVSLKAKTAQGTAYVVELSYCGLVAMRNLPDEQKHMFTYAEAPRLLFPFARAVLADAVQNAGFVARPLDPIDFHGIYIQQLQNQQQQAAAAGGGAPGEGGAN